MRKRGFFAAYPSLALRASVDGEAERTGNVRTRLNTAADPSRLWANHGLPPRLSLAPSCRKSCAGIVPHAPSGRLARFSVRERQRVVQACQPARFAAVAFASQELALAQKPGQPLLGFRPTVALLAEAG